MANLREHLLIFLRGIFMGTADIIPGVSGGTIALITGIYERLVHAISNINSLLVREVINRNLGKAFKNISRIDFALFIPLLSGIGLAFLALSYVMSYFLTEYTAITYSFFFGLILSSSIFVYKYVGKYHWENLFFLAIGLVFGFWFVGLNALGTNHSLVIIFFSGALAICAMILPGISGSFILLLLNQYEFMVNALKNLLLDKIIIFLAGATIGILSFSKLLDILLRKYKEATMSFLTGLMVGSLRLPYQKISYSGAPLPYITASVIMGFSIVIFLEKKFKETT